MRLSPSALLLVALMGVASIGLIGVGVGATLTDTVQATTNISAGSLSWQIDNAAWGDGYNPVPPFHYVPGSISADKHSIVFDFVALGSDIDRYMFIHVKNTGTLPIAWEELTLGGTDHNTLSRSMGVWSFRCCIAPGYVFFLNGTRLDIAEGIGEGSAGEDKLTLKPGDSIWYGYEIATDYFDTGANPLPPAAHGQSVSVTLTVVAGDSLSAPKAPAAPAVAAPTGKTPPLPE